MIAAKHAPSDKWRVCDGTTIDNAVASEKFLNQRRVDKAVNYSDITYVDSTAGTKHPQNDKTLVAFNHNDHLYWTSSYSSGSSNTTVNYIIIKDTNKLDTFTSPYSDYYYSSYSSRLGKYIIITFYYTSRSTGGYIYFYDIEAEKRIGSYSLYNDSIGWIGCISLDDNYNKIAVICSRNGIENTYGLYYYSIIDTTNLTKSSYAQLTLSDTTYLSNKRNTGLLKTIYLKNGFNLLSIGVIVNASTIESNNRLDVYTTNASDPEIRAIGSFLNTYCFDMGSGPKTSGSYIDTSSNEIEIVTCYREIAIVNDGGLLRFIMYRLKGAVTESVCVYQSTSNINQTNIYKQLEDNATLTNTQSRTSKIGDDLYFTKVVYQISGITGCLISCIITDFKAKEGTTLNFSSSSVYNTSQLWNLTSLTGYIDNYMDGSSSQTRKLEIGKSQYKLPSLRMDGYNYYIKVKD